MTRDTITIDRTEFVTALLGTGGDLTLYVTGSDDSTIEALEFDTVDALHVLLSDSNDTLMADEGTPIELDGNLDHDEELRAQLGDLFGSD